MPADLTPSQPGEPGGTLEAVTDFLSRPESYPEKTVTLEVRDTHLSRVFLTDRHVYKLKKPLHYDFLDFTSLDARRRNCEAEVAINAELAPDVYLEVVTLARDSRAGLNLRGRGEPVEYLVKMRRMPDHRNLAVQMARGTLNNEHIDRAARRLARFYRERRDEGAVQPERFYREISGRASELRELPVDNGGMLARLEPLLLALLERDQQALSQRRQVDTHGDLRPEHVYPGPEPVFLDRLEFDARLRLMDPVEELSFFAMECRRLGHGPVGTHFLEVYREVTGDEASEDLVALYTGYRALLWAVLKARHLQRNDDRKPWADLTRAYLSLGVDALERAI